MFYKFNNYSGRIGQTTQQQAYFPQAFQPEVPLPDIPVKPRPRPADNKKMSSVPVSQKPEGLKFGRVPSRAGYQQLMKWQIWFTNLEHVFVWRTCMRAKIVTFPAMAVALGTFGVGAYKWLRDTYVPGE